MGAFLPPMWPSACRVRPEAVPSSAEALPPAQRERRQTRGMRREARTAAPTASPAAPECYPPFPAQPMPRSPHLAVAFAELPALCRSYHISRLWLFGSILRPDFRPDSDIDVLVEFDSSAQVGLLALARARRELSELFGRTVDLVPLRGLKPAVRDEILSQRELIYAT